MGLVSVRIEAACTKRLAAVLRTGPSASFERIKTLPRYTPVEVQEVDGHWFHVKGYDFDGWIFSRSLELDMNCMISLRPNLPFCIGKKLVRRRVAHNEGFKILKKELGCNKVQDKRGQVFWISSISAWPKSQSMLLDMTSDD